MAKLTMAEAWRRPGRWGLNVTRFTIGVSVLVLVWVGFSLAQEATYLSDSRVTTSHFQPQQGDIYTYQVNGKTYSLSDTRGSENPPVTKRVAYKVSNPQNAQFIYSKTVAGDIMRGAWIGVLVILGIVATMTFTVWVYSRSTWLQEHDWSSIYGK